MNKTIQQIQDHRSIRNFIDKAVSEETINEILKTAQSMPSSINGQPIIRIKNQDYPLTPSDRMKPRNLSRCVILPDHLIDDKFTNLVFHD